MSLPDFAAYARKLRAAARRVDSEATPAQREANNYRQGHLSVWGLPIAIEYAKGATRSGTGADGKKWSRVMKAHYGRIKRTVGKDDEPVDVFVGEHPESALVFVVDQLTADGNLDENKIILATRNYHEAKALYLAHYPKGWEEKHLGEVRGMLIGQFKKWLSSRLPVKSRTKTADEAHDGALRFWAAIKSAVNPALTGTAAGGKPQVPAPPTSPGSDLGGPQVPIPPSTPKPPAPNPQPAPPGLRSPPPPSPYGLGMWGAPPSSAAAPPALEPRTPYPTRDFVSPGLAEQKWLQPPTQPGRPRPFPDVPTDPAVMKPLERTIYDNSGGASASPLLQPGGTARPEEQLTNYLKTLPKPQVDAFVAALHNETPQAGTPVPPGLTPDMYARAAESPWNGLSNYLYDTPTGSRPLTDPSSAAADQSAWEVYRRTHPNATLLAKQIPVDPARSDAYEMTAYPGTSRRDVPAVYGTFFQDPAAKKRAVPVGLTAAHEAEHVRQSSAYGTSDASARRFNTTRTALPYSSGIAWAELTPSLGDIPRWMEYLRLRTNEMGDSETFQRPVPAVTFPSGKVMDPFAMHRYAGENRLFLPTDAAPGDKPRPMAELLNTNAGKSWLRQSIQPELNDQTDATRELGREYSPYSEDPADAFFRKAIRDAGGDDPPSLWKGKFPPGTQRYSWFGR